MSAKTIIGPRVRLTALLGLIGAFVTPTFAATQGTPFLQLDFNENNAGTVSATNTGFVSFSSVASAGTTGPISASYAVSDTDATTGTLTVTLSSGTTSSGTGLLRSVNRTAPTNAGSFTYANLYRDFVVADGANSTLWVAITGLRPDFQYDLTFYLYDDSAAGSTTVTVTNKTNVGTANGTGTLTYTGGTTFTSNSQLALKRTATADSTGRILYQLVSTGAQTSPLLNGLIIAQGPPIYASPGNYPGLPTYATAEQATFWTGENTQPTETALVTGAFTSAPKTVRLASLAGATSVASAVSASTLTVSATSLSTTALTFVLPAASAMPAGPFGYQIEDGSGGQIVGAGNLPIIRWAQGLPQSITSADAPLHQVLVDAVETGGMLRLFGRDLPATAYVRFNPASGTATTIAVTAANRYALSVPIPAALATGAYTVQVGASASLDAAYSAPYAINVVAASTLTANPIVPMGLVGDGVTDNTAILQGFLDSNLPASGQVNLVSITTAGTYRISGKITLHPGQYIQGTTGVKFLGSATTLPDVWFTGSSFWGLLDLAIEAQLKTAVIASDSTLAGHVTLNNITITVTGSPTSSTMRTVYLGGPDLLLANSTMTGGSGKALYLDRANGVCLGNLTFNLGPQYNAVENGRNIICENVTILGADPQSATGFSLSRTKTKGAICENQYYSSVSIDTMRGNNREAITEDGGGGAYMGTLSAATSTTLTLAHDPDWTTLNAVAGQGVVTIISGKGQGQYRTLTGASGRALTISQPWTVIPDTASVITISGALRNLIFHDNYMHDTGPAIQVYSPAFDCSLSENIADTCSGFVIRSRLTNVSLPSVNIDVVGNTLTNNANPMNSDGTTQTAVNGIHILSGKDNFVSGVLLRHNTYPAPADLSFEQTTSRTFNVLGELNSGTTRASSLTAIASNPTIQLK